MISSTPKEEVVRRVDSALLRLTMTGVVLTLLLLGLANRQGETVNVFWRWTSIVLTSCSCWGVMERKRWARLAMLGWCAIVLADNVVASTILVAAPGITRYSQYTAVLDRFAVSYASRLPFSPIFVLLALVTMCLLTRDSVKFQFEHRKKQDTRVHQVGIAMVLWIAVFIALSYNGMLRDVRNTPRFAATETSCHFN